MLSRVSGTNEKSTKNDSKCAIERWEGQVEEFKMSASHKELTGIDGEPIEFEWNISRDLHYCRFFRKSGKTFENKTLNLRNLRTPSSSCQCSTTLIGQEKKNDGICMLFSNEVKGHWTFFGPRDEMKWYGILVQTPEGKWDADSHSNGGTVRRYRSSSI